MRDFREEYQQFYSRGTLKRTRCVCTRFHAIKVFREMRQKLRQTENHTVQRIISVPRTPLKPPSSVTGRRDKPATTVGYSLIHPEAFRPAVVFLSQSSSRPTFVDVHEYLFDTK